MPVIPPEQIPTTFILLDTETTGLPYHPKARVVELGAVLVDETGVREDRTFQSMVRPDCFDAVEAAGALAVSGLRAEDFYWAPSVYEVDRLFFEWRAEWGLHEVPLFGWQGHFDHQMLERSGFSRLEVLDIKAPAGRLGAPKGSLGATALKMGIGLDERHRALADAVLAARIWCVLRTGWRPT